MGDGRSHGTVLEQRQTLVELALPPVRKLGAYTSSGESHDAASPITVPPASNATAPVTRAGVARVAIAW
jgi:hypothetical protein